MPTHHFSVKLPLYHKDRINLFHLNQSVFNLCSLSWSGDSLNPWIIQSYMASWILRICGESQKNRNLVEIWSKFGQNLIELSPKSHRNLSQKGQESPESQRIHSKEEEEEIPASQISGLVIHHRVNHLICEYLLFQIFQFKAKPELNFEPTNEWHFEPKPEVKPVVKPESKPPSEERLPKLEEPR